MSDTTTIGKFEITAELGRGGMGVVYKAWEDSLQRFVAIKMLGDQLTQDESVKQRFLREARAVADLNHPNVVQVFTVDTYEGRPYFAMEYVEGESLTDLIQTSNRVNPKRAAQILKEAASGLAAAHAKDVIHRDIKPDNIMLTKHGGVKVVDFGIAKMEDTEAKLTATGMMVGTPNYISPEVCLGHEVDARSDIFSLGIVFYEMLAGTTPFNADSPIAMMTAVVQAEVPDITTLNPEVDERLRAILIHMLMKDTEYRYHNCQQIIEDLTAYLAGGAPPHATAAAMDTTVVRERPELAAPTVEMAAAPAAAAAKPASAGKRTAQAGWVIGLLLIVGAAAGSWYYVEQPDAAPPEAAGSDLAEAATTELPASDTADTTATYDTSDTVSTTDDSIIQPQATEPVVLSAESTLPTETAAADEVISDLASTTETEALATATATATASVASMPPVETQPPAPTGPPKLVVISQGDPSVARVVESVIEGALMEADFPVMDENFFAGFDFATSLAQLGNTVQQEGADILVYADVQETGQRQLQFYGRRERQTTANVEVRALLLNEKRNLGTPWSMPLEYVPLNASDNAKEVATPIAADLVERLNALND